MHGKFTILILAVLKWLAKYISNKDPITVNEHWLNSALLLSFLSRDFDLAILHTSCIKFFKRDLYTKWKPGFDSFKVFYWINEKICCSWLISAWNSVMIIWHFGWAGTSKFWVESIKPLSVPKSYMTHKYFKCLKFKLQLY